MNRRSFLTRLGAAAVGAAALAIDDPERLLWTPGKKTIVDFGATKQVLPATDAEITKLATEKLLASDHLTDAARYALTSGRFGLDGPRDIRLDVKDGSQRGSFKFKDDKLVSLHSEAELKLLDATWFNQRRGGPLLPGHYDINTDMAIGEEE